MIRKFKVILGYKRAQGQSGLLEISSQKKHTHTQYIHTHTIRTHTPRDRQTTETDRDQLF